MPTPSLPADAFRIGSLIVVPSLNRLVRETGTDDLEPRVMSVLATLARTPGEVVTREAFFEAVWSDTVVNDEALTRAVSELRKALGDEARGAIETIRGRGYRLLLPVQPLDPAPADSAPSERPAASEPLGEEGEAPTVEDPGPRVSLPVRLALALASVSLAVSLWAAWPEPAAGTDASRRESQDSLRPSPPQPKEEPPAIDSTSEYYVPGMSELGVYYDSTTGSYFRFVPDEE